MLKRGQDKLKRSMPGGAGLPNWLSYLGMALMAATLAFYGLTFRVDPDELSVVMRFGKPVRSEPPGLHFRLPYPIDEVRLPKVTRQNIIEVGMRSGAGGRGIAGSVEESLMLTGDENIIDVNFVVFWRIQDAMHYLFNIQNPETTVKEVAESAMREVVGQSDIQPLLTGARQKTEQAVLKRMQDVLDSYGAGIRIDQAQLQKVDPPTQVIDAFRDVQAAAADKERLQNEAASYASRVVPEARGDAERILQGARGYREQSVAEATGQTARFLNRAGRPSPGSRPDFGHGRTLHAVTTPFQPRLAATGRLLTRVWAARGASVGRERLRAVIPIAGGDEEHRADKPGRPEGNKGSDERPRHSADQHQACEVGDKSGDQRRCG